MRRKGLYTPLILSLLIIASISYGSFQAHAQTEQEPPDISDEYLPTLTNSSFYLPSREYMTDSVVGPDSSVYAFGYSWEDRVSWQVRMVMARWDGMGNLAWGTIWNVSRASVGYGICLADECFYVVGSAASDIIIGKWGLDGRLLWNLTVDTGLTEDGFAIAVDSGGNMYVCGYRHGMVDQDWIQERILFKLAPGGEIEWLKAFASSTTPFHATGLILHPEGYLLVRGIPHDLSRWYLNGTYNPYGAPLNMTSPEGMFLDHEGNIYTHDRNGGIPTVHKWSSDGEHIWSTTIDGASTGLQSDNVSVKSIAVSQSGTAFILTMTDMSSPYTPWIWSLLGLDSEGEILYRRRVLDYYWDYSHVWTDIHCGSSGLLYVCGTMFNGRYVQMTEIGGRPTGNLDLALGVLNPENSPAFLLGRVSPAMVLSVMGFVALSIGYFTKGRRVPI